MLKRCLVLVPFIAFAVSLHAAALVSLVRLKLSAGDLPSGIAAVEDYKRDTGVDAEYLNAVGWLARGDQRAFSVSLSVLGGRVNADRGGPFVVVLRGEGPEVQGVPSLD